MVGQERRCGGFGFDQGLDLEVSGGLAFSERGQVMLTVRASVKGGKVWLTVRACSERGKCASHVFGGSFITLLQC